MSVTILNHSLVKHKMTNIRKKETKTKDFYQHVNEIAGLMAYEATKHLPLKAVETKTPITMAKTYTGFELHDAEKNIYKTFVGKGIHSRQAFFNNVRGVR